jgi:hypothetical protein
VHNQLIPTVVGEMEITNISRLNGTLLHKEQTGEFYLAPVLNEGNVLVDAEEDVTGITDWEFAYTLPVRAAEHCTEILMTITRTTYRVTWLAGISCKTI